MNSRVLFLMAIMALGGSQTAAAETVRLYPAAAGLDTKFAPMPARANFKNVYETPCDGTASYNYTTTIGHRDLYAVSLSSIPDGSDVGGTFVIGGYAARNSSAVGNSKARLCYRLNGGAVVCSGAFGLIGMNPVPVSNWSVTIPTFIKGPTSTLEIGIKYDSGERGLRISQMWTDVPFTALMPPASIHAVFQFAHAVDYPATYGQPTYIEWDEPDNAAPVDRYDVYRKNDDGSGNTLVVSVPAADCNFDFCIIEDPLGPSPFSENFTYRYTVVAVRGAYSSAPSPEFRLQGLNPPTNLRIQPCSGGCCLVWDDNSALEEGYQVLQYGFVSSRWWDLYASTAPDETSFLLPNSAGTVCPNGPGEIWLVNAYRCGSVSCDLSMPTNIINDADGYTY